MRKMTLLRIIETGEYKELGYYDWRRGYDVDLDTFHWLDYYEESEWEYNDEDSSFSVSIEVFNYWETVLEYEQKDADLLDEFVNEYIYCNCDIDDSVISELEEEINQACMDSEGPIEWHNARLSAMEHIRDKYSLF